MPLSAAPVDLTQLWGRLSEEDETLWPEGKVPSVAVPLQLRCVATGRTHTLREVTLCGRSQSRLRPSDLVLGKPDVSRLHARLEVTAHADGMVVRVFDISGRDDEKAATTVDGIPVGEEDGVEVYVGSLLRFGEEELWELIKAPCQTVPKMGFTDVCLAESRQTLVLDEATYLDLRRVSTWGECSLVLLEHLREVEALSVDVNAGIRFRVQRGVDAIAVQDDSGGFVCDIENRDPADTRPVAKLKKNLAPGYTLKVRLVDSDTSTVSVEPSPLHDGRPTLDSMVGW